MFMPPSTLRTLAVDSSRYASDNTAREASPSPGATAFAPDELEFNMDIVDNIMDPVEPTRQPEQNTTILPSSLCMALFGPSVIILDRKRLNRKLSGDTLDILEQARYTRRKHPFGSPYLVLWIARKAHLQTIIDQGTVPFISECNKLLARYQCRVSMSSKLACMMYA